MSQAPIMPFYTDAYLADCYHLSTEAHGAYLLILLHTWRMNGKALPDDDQIMMRIVKARNLRKWQELKSELLPFFDMSDSSWRQKKLERTWAEVMQKIETNRENGKRGRSVQLKSDNGLKSKDPLRANARESPGPSINHEPNPDPQPISNFKKEDDIMMMTTTPHTAKALEALEPVMRDSRYFLFRSEHRISSSFSPLIEQAIDEIDAQLSPAPLERVRQIVTRMMLHFPCPAGEQKHRLCADYATILQDFPEDILCAAYQHMLKNHKYHTLPKIADFMTFMEPEMTRRRTVRRKLDILQKQTQIEEVNA